MSKPNNARCPKCHAKMRKSCVPSVTYTCRRCGYQKTEEMDNLTKSFIYGPLYRTKRKAK
jgi:hypothetical protein